MDTVFRRYHGLTSLVLFVLLVAQQSSAGPVAEGDSVRFTLSRPDARSVCIAGDFNNWDAQSLPMHRGEQGAWDTILEIEPGYHQYRFVVDGRWIADPGNPATVKNNYGEDNSIFHLGRDGEIELVSFEEKSAETASERGERGGGKVYLTLIWHQHQPFYLDAARDCLVGPWVRAHATKDYYDMTAMVAQYPEVHVTVNLTPVLLTQIETYYVERIGRFYNSKKNRIRAKKFLKRWGGRTDPWVDLMLRPTAGFGDAEDSLLLHDGWNAFGISRVQIARFPEYAALGEKSRNKFSLQDKLDLKCWFFLAWFDPDFLRGPVELVTGRTVDLSDMIAETSRDEFTRGRPFSEDDANRLVAETFKVMEAILPLHREMLYDPIKRKGQVEVITTPFYHPILPLLYDIRAGRSGTDRAPDTLSFARPEDAALQIRRAAEAFEKWFGRPVTGMWPAEGSVSHEVVSLFAREGVRWIATGDGVLARSLPSGMQPYGPYRVAGLDGGELAVFFRDTELSDMIGFGYQHFEPEAAADDLVDRILAKASAEKDSSRLITVLLDGENAWEWYTLDADAKRFLNAVYRRLSEEQVAGRIVTVTPIEYITGNEERGIPPHPVAELPELDELWPGSWINADFSTWIGEEEENRAWDWLKKVRDDMEKVAGPYRELPENPSRRDLEIEKAWSELLAAEGSDWFWWYGADQNAGEGDIRWDMLFRGHLRQVYLHLRAAGYDVGAPEIPILLVAPEQDGDQQGATARGE